MQSPKARFLEKKAFVSTIRDLVATEPFQAAADAAMLQLVNDLTETTDLPTSAAGFQRIIGARKFRAVLESIGNAPVPPPSKPQTPTLNYSR